MNEPLERGDLPEGQQSNPVPPDLIDILDRRAGRKHSEFGSVVSCLGEILAVHEARVRADVAGAITADLQAARRAAAAPASMESLDRALRIVARHAVAPAESVVGAPTPAARHPEDDCHRCGRSLAIPWAAPSPLWNAVMRSGSINGEELFDGIVCPTCFAQLAQERGIAEVWHFDAARVLVPLETVTPSGRVWDPDAWLWREPVGAPTPISSPSDVAAPRDALSDQDFADLNETIADLRDAAWRAYLAEDDVSAAVNAAVRTAVMLTNRRWIAARERVQTRHASRPDGYCVMCRWPDGSLMSWPCPDYVDSQVGALPEDEGTRQEGLINVEE